MTVILLCSYATIFPNIDMTVEATTFSPRTTTPATNNKYYIQSGYTVDGVRGVNDCILGNSAGGRTYGSVLPNCVGYTWGRAYEIMGQRPTLSMNNANTFWGRTSDGYARGQTPQLGAVICWNHGSSGHVAVIEKVYSNGNVDLSESHWSGAKFQHRVNVNPKTLYSNFQGFIYILNNAGRETGGSQTTQKTYTIQASSGANVRQTAGTGATIVGAIAKGSVVRYTETKIANGLTWMLIETGSTFTSGSWGKNIGYWIAMV